jgi:hypothetical protein
VSVPQALYGLGDTGNGHLRNALEILSCSLGLDCIEPTAFAISLPTFGFHLFVVEAAMDVHVVHLLGDVMSVEAAQGREVLTTPATSVERCESSIFDLEPHYFALLTCALELLSAFATVAAG